MDNRYLPTELIHQITSYINPPHRSSAACISRAFQISIEHSNFCSIRITSSELSTFTHYFRFQHRRDALRNLQYGIILPEYSADSCKRIESRATRRRNNETFSKTVVGLLRVLSMWETEKYGAGAHDDSAFVPMAGGGLSLLIDKIYTHSDLGFRKPEIAAEIFRESWKDLGRYRYKYSYLRLVPLRLKKLELGAGGIKLGNLEGKKECEEVLEAVHVDDEMGMTERVLNGDHELLSETFAIPKVLGVTRFAVKTSVIYRRNIEPATVAMLAASMPNLKEWIMDGMKDNETRFVEMRQRMRMDFGKFLLNFCNRVQSFTNLQSFHLDLSSPQPLDHSYSVPAIHPSHSTTDFLSLGLHKLSRLPNLKCLRLHNRSISSKSICLSPEFFWPSIYDHDEDESSPSWPSLECVEIFLSPFTPSGTWYTTNNPSTPRRPPFNPEYSSELDFEDNFSDRSVTPPPLPRLPEEVQSSFNPSYGADVISKRTEFKLAGLTPFDPWRNVLDPETFTPLLLAITRFISKARLQKLTQLRFSLVLGKCVRNPDSRGSMSEAPMDIDFDLAFFRPRQGLDMCTGDTLFTNKWNRFEHYYAHIPEPLGPGDHVYGSYRDKLIISARKMVGWDVIEEREEVRKALRDAVGAEGIIRVVDLWEVYPRPSDTKLKEFILTLDNPQEYMVPLWANMRDLTYTI